MMTQTLLSKIVLYNLCLSFSLISFRLAQDSIGNAELSAQFLSRFVLSPWIILGLGLAFGTRLLNYSVINEVGVNQSMILLSSAYAFLYALTWLILGETLTGKQIVGTGLIMAGIWVSAQ